VSDRGDAWRGLPAGEGGPTPTGPDWRPVFYVDRHRVRQIAALMLAMLDNDGREELLARATADPTMRLRVQRCGDEFEIHYGGTLLVAVPMVEVLGPVRWAPN
jgi:hypothetical protein